MPSDGAETIANRDAPIPVVQVHPADDKEPTVLGTEASNTDNGSSHHFSASKLKDKLESLGLDHMSRESTSRMGDKMVNLYVQP